MNLAVASWVAEAGVDENMALAILDTSPAHLLSINTMRHEASVPSWLEDVLHVAARGIDLAVAEGANFQRRGKSKLRVQRVYLRERNMSIGWRLRLSYLR